MTRSNLTTDGSEFNLPNGRSYSGPYHIHIDTGAMEGSTHVNTPHARLTPKNSTVAERVAAVQTELRAQRARSSKINQVRSQPSAGGGY
jgi:hypothetical protein